MSRATQADQTRPTAIAISMAMCKRRPPPMCALQRLHSDEQKALISPGSANRWHLTAVKKVFDSKPEELN